MKLPSNPANSLTRTNKYTVAAVEMGAVNIWNAMEVAEGASDGQTSGIPSSHLTIDHSLSIPEMKPRLVYALFLYLSVP